MKSWQYILLGVLGGFVASGLAILVASPAHRTALAVTQSTPSMSIVVDVDGYVLRPGVYTLQTGDRINDAISAAGGFRDGADTYEINLASFLSDGQKILVPKTDDVLSSPSDNIGGENRVNLNSATVEDLIGLPGIGEQKANAIIEYRASYGNFSSIEDLLYVPGIGQSLLDTIRDYVTVEK